MALSAPTSAWSARAPGYGAVMIVAMLDAEHAVLVEEYCGGTDEYELSLPKGLIEPGEDVLAAADRSSRKRPVLVRASWSI
jgi:ADP-ribose diphosphatase